MLPPDDGHLDVEPNSISAGAPSQTPLGELRALSQITYLDLGPHCRRVRGWAGEEDGKARGREGRGGGREKEDPQVTVEPGLLRALLRHCGSGIFSGIFPLQE